LKTKISNIEWNSKKTIHHYENTLFDNLTIRNLIINDISFLNCSFKNCFLGFSNIFSNVIFENCSFLGKYFSFGNPKGNLTKYENCHFSKCSFSGTDIFNGSNFISCFFSGCINNSIFRESIFPLQNLGVIFEKCDLSQIVFSHTAIYGENIFSTSILPHAGIRKFNNSNNRILNFIEQNRGFLPGIKALFNKNIFNNHNLILIDESNISVILKNRNEHDLYKEIIEIFNKI
jgi:uncharacterized protein YjbI with pentapeptide repeats